MLSYARLYPESAIWSEVSHASETPTEVEEAVDLVSVLDPSVSHLLEILELAPVKVDSAPVSPHSFFALRFPLQR